jgi:hypothetical protein
MACKDATIDDLMRDALIGAMMRADRVEPQALRGLLAEAAARLARPAETRSGEGSLASKPPAERRAPLRTAGAPARPSAARDSRPAAFCCG